MNHEQIEKRTSRTHKTIALISTIAIHGALFAYLGLGQLSGSSHATTTTTPAVSKTKVTDSKSKPAKYSKPAASKSKKDFKIKA